MATASLFPTRHTLRSRGSTLTRLGAALAACAVRAEQRQCLAEQQAGDESRQIRLALEPTNPSDERPASR